MASTPWPSCLPEASLLQVEGEERRQAGQAHFTEVMTALLHRVSHPQLRELAEWACGEAGNLHTSQISQLRNNQTRMLGSKVIDALGRVNQLAWLAARHPELLPLSGCAPLTPRIQRLLVAYQPLLDPISREPLGSGALLELYLGLRRLPVQRPRRLSLEEGEQLAARLGDWLEGELRERELSFREAGRRLQALWEGEPAGARRLVRVLAGLEEYSAKQVVEGWERIGKALLSLLDLGSDVWALADELLVDGLWASELSADELSAGESGAEGEPRAMGVRKGAGRAAGKAAPKGQSQRAAPTAQDRGAAKVSGKQPAATTKSAAGRGTTKKGGATATGKATAKGTAKGVVSRTTPKGEKPSRAKGSAQSAGGHRAGGVAKAASGAGGGAGAAAGGAAGVGAGVGAGAGPRTAAGAGNRTGRRATPPRAKPQVKPPAPAKPPAKRSPSRAKA